ncbi:FAD-dependent oxidoreductase, partial [Candidatus Bathyarchaeota archaeon]|nr:FAD-dependent oxidoreductase [Candidatus Bathyarchaeota archaeon]
MKFDVIIVGAGPAGIFSAFELTENTKLSVLILDKGPDIDQRKRPADKGLGQVHPDPSVLLSGWGGAGAFSDGKLTLSTRVGGWLTDYRTKRELEELIHYVDDIYVKFGAPKHLYGFDPDKIDDIERRASLVGLKLVQQKIRHMGTENCADTLSKLRRHLDDRIEVRTGTEVKRLLVNGNRVRGVESVEGEKFPARYVIVAPGRGGAEWLKCEAQSLGLKTLNNPVDVGIRVEVLAPVMADLTDVLYEPKLIYYSKCFDD